MVALAANTRPIGNLPPTPMTGQSANASTIRLNELLSDLDKQWNCDGQSDATDQCIKLKKHSSNADISGFELLHQNSDDNLPVALPIPSRICANSFLLLFNKRLPQIQLFVGGGTPGLLGSPGAVIDAVDHPALAEDQSHSCTAGGQ
jgi:hypothetical protein